MTETDFIIIGAGSAGCVLANKLSEEKNNKVTLLEAGPSDNKFWIKTPIGYGITFTDESVNWGYNTSSISQLDNRSMYWPRGKVLGGSSSINALVYHRGQARDYDDWAATAGAAWNYNSVKKIYHSFENIECSNSSNKEPVIRDRASSHTLNIFDANVSYHAIKEYFFSAFKEIGLLATHSPNIEGEGLGPYFINTKKGKRCSSSSAFLDPIKKRSNIDIKTKSLVTRILFKDRRAFGVEYFNNGTYNEIRARKEILVCCGSINSPQILQLSGIGSGVLLQSLDIPIVLDQKHVGQHLQDHLGINYFYRANRPTLNDVLGTWHGRFSAGLKYLIHKTGPLSLSVNQIGGLTKSINSLSSLDTQLYCNPISYRLSEDAKRNLIKPDPYSGFIIGYNSCRPTSEGSIHIQSPDASKAPQINPNYLSTQTDVEDVISMSRLIGQLQDSKSIMSLLSQRPDLDLSIIQEEKILEDFCNRATTVYHPCGTCRMGTSFNNSVVDNQLRIHGVDGIRVVDASVFPNITSANTNAPTIMVAHNAAKFIRNSFKDS